MNGVFSSVCMQPACLLTCTTLCTTLCTYMTRYKQHRQTPLTPTPSHTVLLCVYTPVCVCMCVCARLDAQYLYRTSEVQALAASVLSIGRLDSLHAGMKSNCGDAPLLTLLAINCVQQRI